MGRITNQEKILEKLEKSRGNWIITELVKTIEAYQTNQLVRSVGRRNIFVRKNREKQSVKGKTGRLTGFYFTKQIYGYDNHTNVVYLQEEKKWVVWGDDYLDKPYK